MQDNKEITDIVEIYEGALKQIMQEVEKTYSDDTIAGKFGNMFIGLAIIKKIVSDTLQKADLNQRTTME